MNSAHYISIPSKVLKALISPYDNILIGVSGGADSTYLLYLLSSLKDKLNLSLSICHFNHCLRKESCNDAEFVKGLAGKFGLPFYLENWKDPVCSQKMARAARYDFFLRIAKGINANKIALGHNLDDNVETILFHIIRGEGPYSIPEEREMEGIKIIRPLLQLEKKEIEKYLLKNKIPFIIDKTNNEPIYTRNKIRLKLIPVLSEFNPRFKDALIKLSIIWKRNISFLDDQAKKGVSNKSHPAILAHILRKEGLSFAEIEKRIKSRGQNLRTRAQTGDFCYNLSIPGEAFVNDIKIEAEINKPPLSFKTPKEIALFDYSLLKPPFFIRNIKEGDRFIPFGSNYSKKVARFFILEKIPKEKRRKIPILFDQEGILWIIGIRRSNRAIITEKTGNVLVVKFSRLK